MHASEVEIHTLQKFCHFHRYEAKTKQFCQKCFIPVTWAGVFIWENLHAGYRDLGNQASPASHKNTSEFLRRKDWQGKIWNTEPARLTGLI